ncbi:hypothetical protein DFJ74DRAFT_702796 [Hyaloraphidium curvatum]|nr:hypothetical protein DFJ74DRAFT_702796 [Hyaloraphidium curvatum]
MSKRRRWSFSQNDWVDLPPAAEGTEYEMQRGPTSGVLLGSLAARDGTYVPAGGSGETVVDVNGKEGGIPLYFSELQTETENFLTEMEIDAANLGGEALIAGIGRENDLVAAIQNLSPGDRIAHRAETMAQKDYNLEAAFRFMMWRRLERLRTGTIGKPSMARFIVTVLVFAFFILMVGVYGRRFYELNPWESLVVGVILLPIIFFVAVSSSFSVALAFYWVAIGSVVLLIVAVAAPGDREGQWFYPSPTFNTACSVVVWVTVALVIISMLTHLIYYYFWPWYITHGFGNSVRDWRIRKVANRKGAVTYGAWEPAMRRFTRNLVVYRGMCDDEGRPHAFGEWRDDSTAGECLQGYWSHGLPVGPFVSRESGTGNAFSAMRCGFARNCAGGWKEIRWFPQRGEGLAYGLAVTECSIAGAFFSKLPATQLLIPPTLKSKEQDVVEKVVEGLALGTDPTTVDKTEDCIIFVHGYNASLESAFVTFCQLLSLGDFPKKFRPFIFNWPAGGPVTYLQARTMIESEACRGDFVEFIRDLGNVGFDRFTLIGHSMGARMPVGITPQYHTLFRPLPGSDLPQPSTALPTLSALVLLNGEAHFDDFKSAHFPTIRQFCDNIVVYSDDNDGPLGIAETAGWLFPAPSVTGLPYKALGKHGRELYVEDPAVTMPGRGGTPRPLRRYLDLDVLDTTFLQSNVQGMRHTFFGIARSVVDDLYDVIVERKRAKDRTSRLMRRDGNEFAFQTAPEYYKY